MARFLKWLNYLVMAGVGVLVFLALDNEHQELPWEGGPGGGAEIFFAGGFFVLVCVMTRFAGPAFKSPKWQLAFSNVMDRVAEAFFLGAAGGSAVFMIWRGRFDVLPFTVSGLAFFAALRIGRLWWERDFRRKRGLVSGGEREVGR